MAEGDVGLELGPLPFCGVIHACGKADHHFPVGIELVDLSSTDLNGASEEGIDFGFAHGRSGGDDDEVRAVGDLRLAPGVGQEFFFQSGVGDGDEVPGLEAERGRSQDQRLGDGAPGFCGDGPGGVEFFGGIAPRELLEEVLGRQGAHG